MKYLKRFYLFVFIISGITSFAQTGSEIYLYDLKIADGKITISNGKNITNHKGYDNQPFFHPTKPIVYFASANDSGRTDIKYYDYETKETKNFTTTREREYSPTVTPDGKFISCILQRDNGAQDLVKYPINGGKPEVLVWHLKVGYHTWVNDNKVFLFVLDDSVNNSLHNYDVSTNMDTVVAENIGRSLHVVPSEQSVSYIQKLVTKQIAIKKYVVASGVSSPILYTLPGQDYFCWTKTSNPGQDRFLLSGDGTKLLFHKDNAFTETKDKTWQQMTVEGNGAMLKGVSRIATNADNTKIAIVVSE